MIFLPKIFLIFDILSAQQGQKTSLKFSNFLGVNNCHFWPIFGQFMTQYDKIRGFYGFTLYILTKLCVETRFQHFITHKQSRRLLSVQGLPQKFAVP